jgi:hypothetical protein
VPTVPAPFAPPVGLSITALSTAVGSTGGRTPITVTGTGFQAGSVVTFGGIPASRTTLWQGEIFVETPAHLVGGVDVVISNPDGLTATLMGAFTYAPPETFDFNGSWSGGGTEEIHHLDMTFTVQNGVLTRVTCDSSVVISLVEAAPPVRNGEFSYVDAAGNVVLSGRIVSATAAVGEMNLGPCAPMPWAAIRVAVPPG